MVNVVTAIGSYGESNEKPKSWVESVKKLGEQSGIRNFFSHMKNPSRLDDLKKDFSEALAILMVGAIANNQVLNELKYPLSPSRFNTPYYAWCRTTEDSKNRVLLLSRGRCGKTSVALSIAEECKREKISSASFFFKAGEQSRPDHLFSGMARSLATMTCIPCLPHIRSSGGSSPLDCPFATQFEKLVAEPLRLRTSSSDHECDTKSFPRLADILRKAVPKLPPNIKFFLTSRQFDLVDPYGSAGGLFIWISTVFDYMKMLKKLLDEDLNRSKASAEEMMDRLYASILEKCNWKDDDFKPLSVAAWDAILSPLLESKDAKPIRILHQSFRDFLMDRVDPQSPILGRFGVDARRENNRLPPIPQEALSEHVHYASNFRSHWRPNGPIHAFLNEQISRWVEVCVRTEGYISISFPEWAKLNVDRASKEVIHIWRNLAFFLRLQEAYELASDSVALCHCLHSGIFASLTNLGQHSEALLVNEESVKLWRELVATHPTSYTPDLARALRNLSITRQSWTPFRGTLTIEESVQLWRELVATHPTSYTPDLAGALWNFLYHSTKKCETLARARCHPSASYTPDLAVALRNLCVSLDNVGRHSEALTVIEESVKLWRELVATHPAFIHPGFGSSAPESHGAHARCHPSSIIHPDLAEALRNLKVSLDEVGRHSEAHTVIEESVNSGASSLPPSSIIHPGFGSSAPESYVSLDKVGRHSEALTVIEESVKLWCELVAAIQHHTPGFSRALGKSVKHWRELVAIKPISYSLDLARALRNLVISLDNLGRHSEALLVNEEQLGSCQ
ncbi:uncharacterized protein EI90DRAFT_3111340 [Cantharellus anzutake]|uniref:uncharacterized protein n=1 Tax=Cantharellus anzutake TaxID=1750568 RepID=UPI001907E8C3|nr:uncharacterized protein EI90DRAFT_3111340 [Cantharellus anzutake]KAF8307581.1 hypothetical protein EI90DRAFT_3111340 [Cantharellus anzutake]